MLIEIENYVYENFKKNKNKIFKMLFPLPETPVFTDEELITFMNEAQEATYLTPEQIREAVRRLEKPIKREKPYYVEVENPIESGDH